MAHNASAESAPSVSSFANSQLELGVSLLKAAPAADNSAVGPYSIHAALMLARAGAVGEAAQELDRVLGTAPYSPAALKAYESLNSQVVTSTDNTSVELASSAWITSRAELKKPYLSTVTGPLKASAQTIDFSRPDEARSTINKWVSGHTAEKIPQLIPQGLITAETVAALVSAMHFKASWQSQFSKDGTIPAPFTTAPGQTRQVQMMQHMGSFLYFEDSAWNGAILPYEGNAYSFLVLVPKGQLTQREVVQALSVHTVSQALSSSEPDMVRIELPRFAVRQSQELSRSLESAGLSVMFSPRGDFSEIATVPVRVSAVQHEAFVQVDENGTEAAAATAVVMAKSAAPFGHGDIKTVTADRPFAFAVVHRETKAPLFIGVVGNPE
jgi:serpin B